MVRRDGEGAYIRIQNKSSYTVEIELGSGRNVDSTGLSNIQGVIEPNQQLPVEGDDDPFDNGGIYEYIEGDVKFRFQKDGYFTVNATAVDADGGGPSSSLYLKVDHDKWWTEDKTPDSESPINVVADVNEEDGTFKIEVRIYSNVDTASWMELLESHIAGTPLCEVGLPGTHDSGTYHFNKDMGASPDSDLTETLQEKLDHGKLLGKVNDWILKQVFVRLCQCQNLTTMQQLQSGIRYLDIRVAYHAESDSYWTCHGVYCVNMAEILQEVVDFCNDHPKEIVIFDINHLYEMDDHHEGLMQLIQETLGEKMASTDNVNATSPVSDYWDNGYQVVVIYCDRESAKTDPTFWHPRTIQSPWPNETQTGALRRALQEKAQERNRDKFFVLQGILTPDVELIKQQVMDTGGVSIQSIAQKCSPKVVDWIEKEEFQQEPLNIVIVDFFQNCSLLPAIINYNQIK